MTPPHTPSWHTLAVYSGHPNRVVLDVIRAWERDLGSVCESYWTRGYVGGAHVRVNVRADAGTASSVLERLADMAADHFETMPTTDDGGYDRFRVGGDGERNASRRVDCDGVNRALVALHAHEAV